jgi:hypothetical protein
MEHHDQLSFTCSPTNWYSNCESNTLTPSYVSWGIFKPNIFLGIFVMMLRMNLQQFIYKLLIWLMLLKKNELQRKIHLCWDIHISCIVMPIPWIHKQNIGRCPNLNNCFKFAINLWSTYIYIPFGFTKNFLTFNIKTFSEFIWPFDKLI